MMKYIIRFNGCFVNNRLHTSQPFTVSHILESSGFSLPFRNAFITHLVADA